MKKTLIFLCSLGIVFGLFAQAPEKMSYQAVIRNNSNQLVTNHAIGMQISILQGSVSGTAVYVETQTPMSNANGLVSIEIGDGSVVSGDFTNIDWSNGPYFIQTETDPTGGTTYSITGVSQLLSVPYALHAKYAEALTDTIPETDPVFGASTAAGITNTDTAYWNNKLDTEADPVFGASVASGITVTDTTYWNNKLDSESDPVFAVSVASGITGTDTAYWNDKLDVESDPVFGASVASGITAVDTAYWNDKSEFDGNYSSLTNAPDIANSTNAKDIHLNTSDANSSLAVTNSDDNVVFKVDGSGKMTGDGSGLSNVRPIVAYAGGNMDIIITSYNAYDPTLVKTVTITVPGPGVIIVQATGYIQWKSTNADYCRMSVISSDIATNTATFGSNYFSYLMLSGDHNLTDSIDEYNNFSYSRTFSVSTAGTYTYNLWADKGYSYCNIQIADVNMQAIYFPTGGTGRAMEGTREEEQEVPVNPNSLSGN